MKASIPDDIEIDPEISFEELLETLRNDRRRSVFFDIETMPADDKALREIFKDEEVKLPEHPGAFDPRKVAYGNTTDPAKRQNKLNSDVVKHNQALANWDSDCQKAKDEAWKKFVNGSPLSPVAGRIAAIGYGLRCGTEVRLLLDVRPTDERGMLIDLWRLVEVIQRRSHKLVSFNGTPFDYPFCVHRSWAYEDVAPQQIITKYNKPADFFVDTYSIYKMGNYRAHVKLDNLARMMGVKRKLEGVTGEMFWKLLKNDKAKALEYLAGDIYCLADVAERMQAG